MSQESRIPPCIGICDWGIGGLGFYSLLRHERPDLDVVYIGDQGVPGYGLLSPQGLAQRLDLVFEKLRNLGATDIAVACNAASTVLNRTRPGSGRTIGMIEPTLEALAGYQVGQVGVIGGGRTIRSGAYGRPLRALGWSVVQRVAQPLSGRIEAGQANDPETLQLLDQILAPISGADVLVLACTHYIVLEPEIRKRLPNANIVDPAAEAWSRFANDLPDPILKNGEARFFTTGLAEPMRCQALAAFGVEAQIQEIVL